MKNDLRAHIKSSPNTIKHIKCAWHKLFVTQLAECNIEIYTMDTKIYIEIYEIATHARQTLTIL